MLLARIRKPRWKRGVGRISNSTQTEWVIVKDNAKHLSLHPKNPPYTTVEWPACKCHKSKKAISVNTDPTDQTFTGQTHTWRLSLNAQMKDTLEWGKTLVHYSFALEQNYQIFSFLVLSWTRKCSFSTNIQAFQEQQLNPDVRAHTCTWTKG